jgi:hypothetical protein
MKHNRALTLQAMLFVVLALTLPPGLHAWQAQQNEGQQAEKEEPETEADQAKEGEIEAKACGPREHKFSVHTDKNQHPTPEPPSDKALVYVIRPSMIGSKIQTKLGVDGQWVGANRGNNYFFLTLEPGEHYFCSQRERNRWQPTPWWADLKGVASIDPDRSAVPLKVEPGKTYYLQQKMGGGVIRARTSLAVLDEAEGKKGLAKCHLSLWEEKGK